MNQVAIEPIRNSDPSQETTMPANAAAPTVAAHFADRDPVVKAIYAKILAASRKLGRVTEDPKKTSIHLVRSTAFAGVATRKAALILTLKSQVDIASPRIVKHQRASARRWYL